MLTTFFKKAPASFNRLKPQNQEQATYCTKIAKNSGLLHTGLSPARIKNMIQAYLEWPGTCFYLDGHKYELRASGITDPSLKKDTLTLIKPNRKQLFICTPQGGLEILRIKPQNKKEMDIVSFLNGCRLDFPVSPDEP